MIPYGGKNWVRNAQLPRPSDPHPTERTTQLQLQDAPASTYHTGAFIFKSHPGYK